MRFPASAAAFRFPALAVALLAAGTLFAGKADAQMSCGAHRSVCESVCTPDRVAHYYFGSLRRCTDSCEPRWQECLRTGVWVDLERRSSGRTEYAPPF